MVVSSVWDISIDVRVARLVGEEPTVKVPVLLEDCEVGDARDSPLGRMIAETLVSSQCFEEKSGPWYFSNSADLSIMSFRSAI